MNALIEQIPSSDVQFIQRAAEILENPSFLARVADYVGRPLEALLRMAPDPVTRLAEAALTRATDLAVSTLPGDWYRSDDLPTLAHRARWTGLRHTAATALTGGVGGAFGTLGLWVELPISTCVMLRSIAAIAAEFGEDLRDPRTRLECLSLFGSSGPSKADDEMESSYYTLRIAMSALVEHAARYVAHTPRAQISRSIANGTAPTLVKFIGKVADRYKVAVSEKWMAQSIPLVGAVGGATINVMFAEYFNRIARCHFGLRHLERRWGEQQVRAIYREAAARTINKAVHAPPFAADFSYRGLTSLAAPAQPR